MDNKEQHFFVPCPHCGQHIELIFKQIAWKGDNPETAVYLCQQCGGEITDQDKAQILRAGCWQEVEQTANRPNMRRWVNQMYSPIIRWADVVEEFLRSRNDPGLLKNFVTFWLAERWEQERIPYIR